MTDFYNMDTGAKKNNQSTSITGANNYWSQPKLNANALSGTAPATIGSSGLLSVPGLGATSNKEQSPVPSGTTAYSGSGDGGTAKTVDQFLEDMNANWAEWEGATNKYIDDLMGEAEGDKDFVIKQLTDEYHKALGTDDNARMAFLEKTFDELENKIGRIPYDYQVGISRLDEDFGTFSERNERNKQLALGRLAEDEQVWKDQFADESQLARENQNEDLLKRGILSGTREGAQGLATKDIGDLETNMARTLQAYDRELGRGREDIETSSSDALFDATREHTRGTENLTTSARRGAQDSQSQFEFGKESAERQFTKEKKALDRLREKELAYGKMESSIPLRNS